MEEDPAVVTWAWTVVEIRSAIERRHREGTISRPQRRQALATTTDLAERWDEVTDMLAVRIRALRLLARHPLRAADAGQLASAQIVAETVSSVSCFVTLDGNLGQAAEVEGFQVLPELD